MDYSKFRTEGSRGIDDLCYVSELLGYRGSFPQLICNNGAAVSSLLNFLEDNPGCVEALWEILFYLRMEKSISLMYKP